MANIYIGDIGTKISLDIGEDISASTVRRIYYLRPNPDGREGYWEATLDTDNQTLYYITESGDLNVFGAWKLQGYVSMPEWRGLSKTVTLVVNKRFG